MNIHASDTFAINDSKNSNQNVSSQTNNVTNENINNKVATITPNVIGQAIK